MGRENRTTARSQISLSCIYSRYSFATWKHYFLCKN